ncbi:hypothetical protein BFF78_36105 [Streptomyces fodineus]|uniref:Uncharacterized protein n=1 Tax=Streptomyces fodineus TaxID=1904616 RepID=A0A1D7YJK2_9ACTN|nr:hypothetical protein [Streptomyces fodineus]AOR35778.1 hypothetical protein BFF78_36105 [Streptomyces fodineus]
MEEKPEERQAAWELYLALHNLADSQTLGQVPTSSRDGVLGDIDDARTQLIAHHAVLRRRHATLAEQVYEAINSWEDRPTDRLMPLLDTLAAIAGSSLPLQAPPTT